MKNGSTLRGKSSGEKSQSLNCTAFAGHRCIASGVLARVARRLRELSARGEGQAIGKSKGTCEPVLVFNDQTGEVMEIDPRMPIEDVVAKFAGKEPADGSGGIPGTEGALKRGPGRPKLGVIPREVTLLPDQWDWLDEQPGGASSALRRLVYEAKNSGQGKGRIRARQSQEAVYRFMTVMAGDFPGFEEALRAFYRRDHKLFDCVVKTWPRDVRNHVKRLVAMARREQAARTEP